MFFLDPLYMLVLIVGGGLSFVASMRVKSAFAKGQKTPMSLGITGAEVAEEILRASRIYDVQVVKHRGFLSDHYNPVTKTLALSPDVYGGRNASAAGVAAHEVGHAIQHAEAYAPLKMRSAIVPVANIGSMIGPWLVIAGMFMGSAEQVAAGTPGAAYYLAITGVVLFALATAFTLVTLPVEYDASARAKRVLKELHITRSEDEDRAVSSVLSAAGLTYVAAAISSLLMLLYWAMRAGLIGGRSD